MIDTMNTNTAFSAFNDDTGPTSKMRSAVGSAARLIRSTADERHAQTFATTEHGVEPSWTSTWAFPVYSGLADIV